MFYERLKEVCEEKNTSPSALCLKMGISKSNVTRWKQGKSPRLDVVQEMAQRLGVPVSRLITKA